MSVMVTAAEQTFKILLDGEQDELNQANVHGALHAKNYVSCTASYLQSEMEVTAEQPDVVQRQST